MREEILSFFKGGGVFLFDEDDPRSESTFYAVEELMGEEAGATITSTEVGDDDERSLFYDEDVLSEGEARDRIARRVHRTHL